MLTSIRPVATAALVAFALMGTVGAKAADLSDPYDDPRYSEIYKDAPPPYQGQYRERYESYSRSYKDEGGYDDGGDRYAYRGDDNQNGRCVPRQVIRDELEQRGWCDFRKLDLREGVAYLEARRPSGRLFTLELDRCTGQLLSAHPLDDGHFRDYAYGAHGPWHND